MGAARFLYNNLADYSTVGFTASSEVSTLPVENVKAVLRTQVWRSTGDTDENITIDLGGNYSVDSVAIVNHNLSDGATITYQSSTVSDFATTVHSETLTYREGIIFKFLTAGSARYHKFRFQDSSNPDGYIEVGRLYLGKYFEPSTNFHSNWEAGDVDLSVVSQAEGGQYFADVKAKQKQINLSWTHPILLSLADREKFEDMLSHVGKHRDFLLFIDQENKPEWTYYGRISGELPRFRNAHQANWYEFQMEFKEAL